MTQSLECEEQGDKTHPGTRISTGEVTEAVKKRAFGNISNARKDERGRNHLNCSVINEKMRTCAVESTKAISSFPHTKAACRIAIPDLLYHGARLMALP
jgi:hypothetical protein